MRKLSWKQFCSLFLNCSPVFVFFIFQLARSDTSIISYERLNNYSTIIPHLDSWILFCLSNKCLLSEHLLICVSVALQCQKSRTFHRLIFAIPCSMSFQPCPLVIWPVSYEKGPLDICKKCRPRPAAASPTQRLIRVCTFWHSSHQWHIYFLLCKQLDYV